MKHCVLAIWILLVGVSGADAELRSGRASFRILSTSANGWVLEYVAHPLPFTVRKIEGKPHMSFSGGVSGEKEAPGAPQLPVEVLNLGIPFGTAVTAEILEPTYETTPDQLVAPLPAYAVAGDTGVVAVYRKDPAAYSQNRYFPAGQVRIDHPFTLRQQRICTVRLFPYQYNPATKTLKKLIRGKLRIGMTVGGDRGIPVTAMPAAPGDPHYEEVYRSLIENYDQAKQWRQSIAAPRALSADPSRDWFETGKLYYRILIAQDGWYQVSRAALAAAGVLPGQIDIPSVKIIGRGVENPLLVRPDSTIEFYALRNYGDSTYYNFYTDTNTYWLTWGGTAGRRFQPIPQPTAGTPADIRSVAFTKHVEQNTAFYRGATTEEILQVGPVPGKDWIWDYFYPNTQNSYEFTLDTIDVANTPFFTLRARLFGTTSNYPPVSHRARFWINDSLAGEISFGQRMEGRLNVSVPSRWFRNGKNLLKILSVDTGTNPNQFYFDWFEIDYRGFLRAVDDQMVFSAPTATGTQSAVFTVSGFSTQHIDVFDPAAGRQITGGVVAGDTLGGYTIAFRDTFSLSRKYVVVGSSGPLPVAPPAPKTFTDIRKNTEGADDIIITHRNFLSAARQLAAHRQSVNNVRVKVITVHDIYDEFNYGVFNAEKIKSFLRYAFNYWPSPAPAYLLMFGDAAYDYHKYFPNSVKTDYVSSYGVPTSDNWFACFDTVYTFLPSMLIGRLPVEDSIQAQIVLTKIINYDALSPQEWDKNFLFIAGGADGDEQASFEDLNETEIRSFVLPPPIGGTPFRVNKSGSAVIDTEHKQELKDLVKDGMLFVNFLGHSSGLIWEVDIGPPGELENTNGRLPFVSSVSCNVGGFADQTINTLSEEFIRADNRGAIGVWGAVSLGYADYGNTLVKYFLSGVARDSVRDFGALTTTARYKMWQDMGSGDITIAMVMLTPLTGDPLSRLALPLLPDLAISSSDMSTDHAASSPRDSTTTLRLLIHNYGLVPRDSVGVAVNDFYRGHNTTILNEKRIAPTLQRDSLSVPLNVSSEPGEHILTAILDPSDRINEVNKQNNSASIAEYVYANQLVAVRPLNNAVVRPGVQRLMVSTPLGLDSAGSLYTFQLDTVETFDSPVFVQSPAIGAGPVGGEWRTPSLPDGRVYFWRAHSSVGAVVGKWVTSSFSTSGAAPDLPRMLWREGSKRQFSLNVLSQTAPTDSGAVIAQAASSSLYSRSVGYLYNPGSAYYSAVGVNEASLVGVPGVVGSSFIVLKFDPTSGSFSTAAFDVAGAAAQADSMTRYINKALAGNYFAISVILDGHTNASESLYVALESLGSRLIRNLQPGQAWAFIGQKGNGGPGMQALEKSSPDSAAEVRFQVPNYYSLGSGTITAEFAYVPALWHSLRWECTTLFGKTSARLGLVGMKGNGSADTLRAVTADSSDLDLSFLNQVSADTAYRAFSLGALLLTSDATVTPVLRRWSLDIEPPADLAISNRTVGLPDLSVPKGTVVALPVTVYNVGYRVVDSARVTISLFGTDNTSRPLSSAIVGSIAVDSARTITVPLTTENLSGRVTVRISVSPGGKSRDLVLENNAADYSFIVTENPGARLQIYADGTQLMDGDYVSAKPALLVRLPQTGGGVPGQRTVEMYVDNVKLGSAAARQQSSGVAKGDAALDDPLFTPDLNSGSHELKTLLIVSNLVGRPDTLSQRVLVNVLNEYHILRVFNYPNPFRTDTYFTMVLTGSKAPEEMTIRIYTIAGRKIRQISAPAGSVQVGFNRLYWDGRDNDGDEVANGTYLYQVEIKGGGKIETVIEKLARVR